MIALGLALGLALGGENRLWYVDLELRSACEELVLDCGAAGSTRLEGPFPGGARRWSVPVPARPPLGAEGLAALALPTLEVRPASSAGAARVLGWSAEQPARRLVELSSAAGAPRPTPVEHPPRAGWPELLLVLGAGGGILALRRRLGLAALLAVAAAGGTLALARGRTASSVVERVLEWRAGDAIALRVTAARAHVVLGEGGLEVSPEGSLLRFVLDPAGRGEARAPGASLSVLEGVPTPDLAPDTNGFGPLDEVWTREPSGTWRAHGPWEPGEPLPAGREVEQTGLPGWLAAGVPPGRSVLVARSARGDWLRCLGFEHP